MFLEIDYNQRFGFWGQSTKIKNDLDQNIRIEYKLSKLSFSLLINDEVYIIFKEKWNFKLQRVGKIFENNTVCGTWQRSIFASADMLKKAQVTIADSGNVYSLNLEKSGKTRKDTDYRIVKNNEYLPAELTSTYQDILKIIAPNSFWKCHETRVVLSTFMFLAFIDCMPHSINVH